MNQRNVEALAALMDARGWADPSPEDWLHMAEWLASQGVLMPSALTDEEALEAWDTAESDHDTAERLKLELERIAKGEPASSSA